jgi:hypothetical protein
MNRKPLRLPLARLVLAGVGLLAAPSLPTSAQESGPSSRELAGIAEEQELLLRQLQRLRNTMEVLLERLEAEGRSRTAELLREALRQLDERRQGEGTGVLTMEERMEQARGSIESGQLVQ